MSRLQESKCNATTTLLGEMGVIVVWISSILRKKHIIQYRGVTYHADRVSTRLNEIRDFVAKAQVQLVAK